ncbi:MAG: bifunctional oligoribonuclease/PAP phosphatase NrnA [Anaerolineales bacterium]|nr:bifunctional oligoribonuclease/PAP phosphatase NrnA [Anaerolineales bacterium]
MATASPNTPDHSRDASAASLALRQVLEAHRGEQHIVVLQNYPDPDAISSAYAHQLISRRFGIETGIVYSGKVSHEQNLALLKLLGLGLLPFGPDLDLNQFAGAVFVDNQGTTAGQIVEALEAANIPALIVVDHHAPQERLAPAFSDIRRTGATATIYAEYLQAGLLDMDRGKRDHQLAATALMHGLLTDTNNFVRAGAEDFGAAAYLSVYYDADLLSQIMSQARSKQTMDVIRRALGNRVVVENFSIAGIGYLRAEDRDAIPQAADFLLTEENVHTAIVYGIVTSEGEEILVGSMRTSKLTLDPDSFIKDTLGKNATGRYFGGGKMSAGGFEVPIGFLSGNQDDEYRELKWQTYDNQLKHKLFAKLGVEPPNSGGSGAAGKPKGTTP